MVKPILYGSDFGFSTRAVKLTAKAIGLEFDYKPIDILKGEQRTSEEYGKINPQRTVPTLVDNGKVISDSHAIVTYLIDVYGKSNMSLYPADPYIRAKVNARLHFESGTMYPKLGAIGGPIMYHGATEFSEELIAGYRTTLDTLEMFLTDAMYVAGNELTVADFSIITSVSTMLKSDIVDFAKYPKIREWVDRIAKLPYYEEINGKYTTFMNDFFKTKIEENKAAKK